MKRIALGLCLLGLPLFAEEMPVSEAIVFKNGLSFVTRQGPLAFKDGRATVAPAPESILGTLWIAAGNRTIDVVRASNETIQVETAATSVAALLDANVGKLVTLLVGDREVRGKLLASDPSLALLEVDGKVHAFNRSDVKAAVFAAPPVVMGSTASARATLTIHARGADGVEAGTVRYLRWGLSWIPEYTIELLDGGRARVTMKATLINDGEDLRNSRVRFAVGYPNFEFSTVPSPMTMQLSLQEFLSRLARDAYSAANRFDNNSMTQQVMLNVATTIGDAVSALPGPPATGESSEDLFFYEREGVTLAKGERALYPILSEVVPFRHIYRWAVVDEDEEPRTYGRPKPKNEVWHSVALTNAGTTPWTTAPALVISNGKPLAQDTLAYTAAGAGGEVKLTVATDVAVEKEEYEVERKPRDLQRFGYTWDAVTVEGTLTLRSFKRTPITLEVTKDIEGQSISRTPEGTMTRLAQQPKAVNPNERLEWEVPLPAGGTVVVKYRYKVWVRE